MRDKDAKIDGMGPTSRYPDGPKLPADAEPAPDRSPNRSSNTSPNRTSEAERQVKDYYRLLALAEYEAMSVILCTAGYDHTIRFWEALSGICSRTIQHPESQVNRLCITPDKKFLAAGGRHNVKLYDIRSTNPNPIMTFDGHTGNITGVAFHCEGKWMVTSSEDSTVKVWDTRSGSLQRNYHHTHPVHDVVIHPNQGELISGDRGGNVRVWDLGENRCTHQLIPEEDVAVASVSVASDGSLLAAGMNKGNVYVWRMFQNSETTQLVPVTHFNAHKEYLTRVLISPDVKNLATCSADHTAKIWAIDPNEEDLISPEERATRIEQRETLLSAKPSSTSSMNLASLTAYPVTPHPFSTMTQKYFPANGVTETVDNFSDTTSPPEPLPLYTTLEGHQRWVWDCAFSADSAYLVTVCSDHYARLWELSSSTIIRQYNGHHRGAVCVALNDYSEPGPHM